MYAQGLLSDNDEELPLRRGSEASRDRIRRPGNRTGPEGVRVTADPGHPEFETHRESIAEVAMDLLSYDTSNPPGETGAIAEYVERFFETLGVETRRVVADPAKPNLLATIPGKSSRKLLFVGHLDTVPFDTGEWSVDPLGERDGGRIYGRGATDMKGPLAAMLAVARAYAETLPPLTLEFVIVSDEEVAGEAGLPAVLEKDAIDGEAAVIGETTCSRGQHSVTVADRGSIWLTLEADGEAAHGSRPMLGENAVDRLYEAVETIREKLAGRSLDLPEGVGPIVEESAAYYEPTIGEDETRELFEHPTVNLGILEGGEAVNSVPTAARARLDVRLAPGVETPEVFADLRGCIADCEGVSLADASWSIGTYEDPNSPLVDAVASVAADVTGDPIYRRSATGGGDAKQLRNAKIPTVEFALGTDTVHVVDEYTTLDALVGNAEIYARLPYELADRIE